LVSNEAILVELESLGHPRRCPHLDDGKFCDACRNALDAAKKNAKKKLKDDVIRELLKLLSERDRGSDDFEEDSE
jgi:hypothetical protein